MCSRCNGYHTAFIITNAVSEVSYTIDGWSIESMATRPDEPNTGSHKIVDVVSAHLMPVEK